MKPTSCVRGSICCRSRPGGLHRHRLAATPGLRARQAGRLLRNNTKIAGKQILRKGLSPAFLMRCSNLARSSYLHRHRIAGRSGDITHANMPSRRSFADLIDGRCHTCLRLSGAARRRVAVTAGLRPAGVRRRIGDTFDPFRRLSASNEEEQEDLR